MIRALALALALLLVGCGSDVVLSIDASTIDAATTSRPGRGYAAFAMPELGGERYEIRSAVVEDLVTGLIWQRGDTGALRTLEDARAECDALELDGRDDFRLPTRVEWVSIVAPARSPTVDGDAFPDALAEYHWSTSEPDEAPGSAFSVYLGAGETTLGLASRPSARVRCVAAGPAPIDGAQHEVRDEGVHDRGTGLTWSRAVIDATTWTEARDACTAIDARLPTIRELQTLVDESRRAPAIDPALFPDTPSERHWTSTIRDAGEPQPWTVDFLDGQTYADELGDVPHVARCVI